MLQKTASPAPAQNVGAPAPAGQIVGGSTPGAHTVGQIPAAEAGEAITGRPVTPMQAPSGTTEHKPESSGGLPQFKTEVWPAQILWLLILFGALYLLLSRVFIPRLRKVKDDRAEAIDGAIAAARAAQAEADSQSKAAQAELSEARAKAQKTASDAKHKAASEALTRQKAQEEELNAKLAEAETRIRASRDRAMESVQTIAADTAHVMLQRLTGEAPAEGEVQAALSSAASATRA